MKLPTVKNERLYQKIANLLIELIENGTFKPGEYLPAERELSKSIGVSRSSLREALVALEISGVIEIQSGAGIFVRDTNSRANYPLSDLLKARKIIDGETAYSAANADVVLKQKLKELYLLMNFYVETNKVSEFYKADRDFHILIAKLSNNKVFYDMVKMLWDRPLGYPYIKNKVGHSDLNVIKTFHQQHSEIINAIMDGDASRAKLESIVHIKFVEDFWLTEK